jgi:hypothetical protein
VTKSDSLNQVLSPRVSSDERQAVFPKPAGLGVVDLDARSAVSPAIDRSSARRNEDGNARPCLVMAATSRVMPNRSAGNGPLAGMLPHDEQADR